MFVYSKIHNWQNEKAVKQVLVFGNQEEKNAFDAAYKERLEKSDVETASDTGIGASYKLRAVKDDTDRFIPAIRSGSTAAKIWEGQPRLTWQDAMRCAISELQTMCDMSVDDSDAVQLLNSLTEDMEVGTLV